MKGTGATRITKGPVIAILSRSDSFSTHASSALGAIPHRFFTSLTACSEGGDFRILLLHLPSFEKALPALLQEISGTMPACLVAIASDRPGIEELLHCGRFGIAGYYNSYMAAVHFRHMVDTLANGQCWYAPQLLGEMMALARQGSARHPITEAGLETLTEREKQIAFAVTDGLNNKAIAQRYAITERTVKAHLTKIYEKLGLKGRLELARYLLARSA